MAKGDLDCDVESILLYLQSSQQDRVECPGCITMLTIWISGYENKK